MFQSNNSNQQIWLREKTLEQSLFQKRREIKKLRQHLFIVKLVTLLGWLLFLVSQYRLEELI